MQPQMESILVAASPEEVVSFCFEAAAKSPSMLFWMDGDCFGVQNLLTANIPNFLADEKKVPSITEE